jgi:ribulose-5-phosphate 4-epimerase/fuculose-1-phosphate aldolase
MVVGRRRAVVAAARSLAASGLVIGSTGNVRRAVLLAGHGLVAVGSSLTQAIDISVAVEHEAQIASLAPTARAAHR